LSSEKSIFVFFILTSVPGQAFYLPLFFLIDIFYDARGRQVNFGMLSGDSNIILIRRSSAAL
jgi:hypothetical protein